jgi:hypothetical protein
MGGRVNNLRPFPSITASCWCQFLGSPHPPSKSEQVNEASLIVYFEFGSRLSRRASHHGPPPARGVRGAPDFVENLKLSFLPHPLHRRFVPGGLATRAFHCLAATAASAARGGAHGGRRSSVRTRMGEMRRTP